jgi:ketosteroid isomerase-like protein
MQLSTAAQLPHAFADAFNRADADALVAIYEDGAALVPPGAPAAGAVRGEAPIRELAASFFAMNPKIAITSEPQIVEVGELALLVGTWQMQATGEDGSPVELSGTYTDVGRRQPDGTWRYVIDNPAGAAILDAAAG